MTTFLQICIILVTVTGGALVTKRFEPQTRVLLILLNAFLGAVATMGSGYIAIKLAEPEFRVLVSPHSNWVEVNVAPMKTFIQTASIQIPIAGTVTDFEDNNSASDAISASAYSSDLKNQIGIVDSLNRSIFLNSVVLSLSNIHPNTPLNYKITFQPNSTPIEIAGGDYCQIQYTWPYAGNMNARRFWVRFGSTESVAEPNIRIEDFTLTPAHLNKVQTQNMEKPSKKVPLN